MAYPAFFVSPWQYRCNWHSTDTRNHQQPNSQRIIADSDAHATAFVTTLQTYLSAQNTSLTKRLGVHNPAVAHPAGSRLSANVLCLNAVGGTQRYHLRNFKTSITDAAVALTALFTGIADATSGVVALTAPPNQPDGGPAITVVNSTIITKH